MIKNVQFIVNRKAGPVSGLLMKPAGAQALLVLAHGAGAGMRHRFMEDVTERLARGGVATLRYQFPYMERHRKRPDPQSILTDTVRAAVADAGKHAGPLPLFAGGKSMGGRMTSLAAANEPLGGVRGLVFFGFPLHAAGRPSMERGEHLTDIRIPMLFLQGSRDPLADLELLQPLCRRLGRRAELFVVEGGDHSFHMLKSSGESDDQILDRVIDRTLSWIYSH
ncbi:MAG TPA: alpha/beta family hydrolase [Terriglobales bacterium]|nr:alpha/beta family hydrolase [Terriglobales bacterium]